MNKYFIYFSRGISTQNDMLSNITTIGVIVLLIYSFRNYRKKRRKIDLFLFAGFSLWFLQSLPWVIFMILNILLFLYHPLSKFFNMLYKIYYPEFIVGKNIYYLHFIVVITKIFLILFALILDTKIRKRKKAAIPKNDAGEQTGG